MRHASICRARSAAVSSNRPRAGTEGGPDTQTQESWTQLTARTDSGAHEASGAWAAAGARELWPRTMPSAGGARSPCAAGANAVIERLAPCLRRHCILTRERRARNLADRGAPTRNFLTDGRRTAMRDPNDRRASKI